MSRREKLIAQLRAEAKTSRKFIDLVPMDQTSYKPHEKSMELIHVATHLAELPLWAEMAINSDGLDFATSPYNPVKLNTKEEFLTYFEECVAKGIKALEGTNEEELDKLWVLRNGETIYSSGSKEDMIRVAHNQTVHHRAQLGVYYRLLGIPVPQSYGPTADFPEFEES